MTLFVPKSNFKCSCFTLGIVLNYLTVAMILEVLFQLQFYDYVFTELCGEEVIRKEVDCITDVLLELFAKFIIEYQNHGVSLLLQQLLNIICIYLLAGGIRI